jgi:hypothetical protein
MSKPILILGGQGSGKTHEAFQIIGGKSYVEVDGGRSQSDILNEICQRVTLETDIILIEGIEAKRIKNLSCLLSLNSLHIRPAYQRKYQDIPMPQLVITSQDKIYDFPEHILQKMEVRQK